MQFGILQALLVGVVMLTIPMLYAFGGRVKMSGGDLALLLPIFPVFIIVTMIVFMPFEGNWADTAFGKLGTLRGLMVGGAFLVLGTLYTQRHQLPKLGANAIAHRLGAVFLIGAVWGVLWTISGWLLTYWGMMSNG